MKKVFVLSQRSMFHKGIEALLSQRAGLEIVGQDTDPSAAAECIQAQSPDVIILNLDDPEPDLSSAVLCILRDRPGVSIIGLSLRDNQICIYRGEDKQVLEVDDLFEAILN